MKELCLYMILILNAQLTIAQEAIRPWIGVQIEHSMLGVLIENTYPDTPAARAGLSTGDTIILIDGEKVSTPKELIELVAQKGVGNKVTLTYIDNSGSEKETQLELEVMPGMSKLAEKKLLNKSLPKFDLNILSKSTEKRFDTNKNIGKVKIIEFWATWCRACKMANKPLHDFAKKHQGKIQVLTISSEKRLKLKKYLAATRKKPFFHDSVIYLEDVDGKVSSNFLVPALPMFIVIDKKNIVRYLTMGVGKNLNEAFKKAVELNK